MNLYKIAEQLSILKNSIVLMFNQNNVSTPKIWTLMTLFIATDSTSSSNQNLTTTIFSNLSLNHTIHIHILNLNKNTHPVNIIRNTTLIHHRNSTTLSLNFNLNNNNSIIMRQSTRIEQNRTQVTFWMRMIDIKVTLLISTITTRSWTKGNRTIWRP